MLPVSGSSAPLTGFYFESVVKPTKINGLSFCRNVATGVFFPMSLG